MEQNNLNGSEMSQIYDGRIFPEYCYEDCVMEVEMFSRYAPADSPATYLYLPITQIQQARAIARAGGNFYEDMCLHFLESELPEEVDAALDFENENLTDFNEMCRTFQSLNQAEREKLGAVIELIDSRLRIPFVTKERFAASRTHFINLQT